MTELAKLHKSLDGYQGLTPEAIRDRIAELGSGDPELGHGWVDDLAHAARIAVSDGHEAPAALARDVLVVISAEFRGGTREPAA